MYLFRNCSSDILNGFEAEELLDLDKVLLPGQRCSECSGGALTLFFPHLHNLFSFPHLFCMKKGARVRKFEPVFVLHEKYEARIENQNFFTQMVVHNS